MLETTLNAAFGPAIVAGREVTTLTYDGNLPGPTLRLNSGDTLKLRVTNGFDQTTNFHTTVSTFHPVATVTILAVGIAPGEQFDFQFDLPADHPPGTY